MILHDTVVRGHVWWNFHPTANLRKLIKLTARFPFLNHFIRPSTRCGSTRYNKNPRARSIHTWKNKITSIFLKFEQCIFITSKLFYISISLLAWLYPPLNRPNKPAVNWLSPQLIPRPRTRSSGFLNTLVTSVYADTKSGPFVRGFNVGYTASVGVAGRDVRGKRLDK